VSKGSLIGSFDQKTVGVSVKDDFSSFACHHLSRGLVMSFLLKGFFIFLGNVLYAYGAIFQKMVKTDS